MTVADWKLCIDLAWSAFNRRLKTMWARSLDYVYPKNDVPLMIRLSPERLVSVFCAGFPPSDDKNRSRRTAFIQSSCKAVSRWVTDSRISEVSVPFVRNSEFSHARRHFLVEGRTSFPSRAMLVQCAIHLARLVGIVYTYKNCILSSGRYLIFPSAYSLPQRISFFKI